MPIERRYWDSGCFLAVMKAEPFAEKCRGVIAAAKDGRVHIVTSAWALTEVVHLGETPMTIDDDRKIRDFFKLSYVTVIDVTPAIAHHARELVWTRAFSRKDAIHVASAVAAKCPVLDTSDDKLVTAGGQGGGVPGLRITHPDLPYQGELLPKDD